MAAFRNAVDRWGVDMVELDVRLTRDGVVVVFHDALVDRTTNGSGRLADLTWDDLQELDAGYHFRDPQGQTSFRGQGERVPAFRELLEAYPDLRLNVEAKEAAVAEPLVEMILKAGAQDRVLVAAEFEKNRKSVIGYPGAWGASRLQVTAFVLLLATPLGPFYTPACDVLQVPEKGSGITIVTPRLIREAHRRNLPVHVWTVNDPVDMRKLLAWGVDGIQTDRPDLLAPILTEMVGRSPAPCLLSQAPDERGSNGISS
jgi:glycerophosphoryl diester phosphodiesterase